jgi:hypothetical protein
MIYDDKRDFGRNRWCIFITRDLSILLVVTDPIRYAIYGKTTNPYTGNRCYIGCVHFTKMMSEEEFRDVTGMKNCVCKYPVGEKEYVSKVIRNTIDNVREIGTPCLEDVKDDYTPGFIQQKVEEGWIYEDFLRDNKEEAVRNRTRIYMEEIVLSEKDRAPIPDVLLSESDLNNISSYLRVPGDIVDLNTEERRAIYYMRFLNKKRMEEMSPTTFINNYMTMSREEMLDMYDYINEQDYDIIDNIAKHVKRRLISKVLEL